jgi:hypothetical protein
VRRKDHEEIVREKNKTISRLERENEQLLDRIMYLTGTPWTPPPVEIERLEDEEVEHEDADFPYMTSNPELTGI